MTDKTGVGQSVLTEGDDGRKNDPSPGEAWIPPGAQCSTLRLHFGAGLGLLLLQAAPQYRNTAASGASAGMRSGATQ